MLRQKLSLLAFCLFLVSFLHAQAPVNDVCSGAIELFPNASDTIKGSVVNAVPSLPTCGNSAGNTYKTVWYKFTASEERYNFLFLSDTTLFVRLYKNTCDSLLPKYGCWKKINFAKNVILDQLTIDETYYLEVHSPWGIGDFKLKLSPFAAPPSNATCKTAQSIVPSLSSTCTATLQGTNENGNLKDGLYNVWYEFTASSQYQKVALGAIKEVALNSTDASDGLRIFVQVFADDCDSLVATQVYASGWDSPQNNYCYTQSKPFEVGKKYLIQVSSYSFIKFDVCLFTQQLAPNSTCDKAITLPNNPQGQCINMVSGSTENIPSTNLDTILYPYYPGKFLWYQFEGTGNPTKITFNNIVSTPAEASYYWFITDDCTTLNPISNPTVSAMNEPMFLTELGKNYHLVWQDSYCSSGYQTFNICRSDAPPAVANDEPQGAIPIPISPNMTTSTWVQGDLTNCYHTDFGARALVARDIWYSFTAVQSTHILNIRNIKSAKTSNQDQGGGYLLLDENKKVLQQGLIYYLSNQISKDSTFYLTELTKNKKYYLVFEEYAPHGIGYSFKASITTPPIVENDACANAITVPVNTKWSCTNTTEGTTRWSLPNNASNQRDIWYKFTATATQHLIRLENMVNTNNNSAPEYGFECLALSDCIAANPTEIKNKNGLVSDLSVGETYYIRIFVTTQNDIFFDLCVTTPITITPNTKCATAISIPINVGIEPDLVVKGTTAYSQYPSGPNSSDETDDNVWYKFTATKSLHQLQLSDIQAITGNNSYLKIFIYEGKQCDSLTIITSLYGTPQGVHFNLSDLVIGKTYFIQLYTPSNDSRCTFSLALISPTQPANDYCFHATALTINSDTTAMYKTLGTLRYGTAKDNSAVFTDAQHPDVWYSFLPTTPYHSLRLKSLPNSDSWQKYLVELYEGTDCSHLTLKQTYSLSKSLLNSPFLFPKLDISKKYYLRIYDQNNVEGECSDCHFEIALFQSPATSNYDECVGALTLNVSPNLMCTEQLLLRKNATFSFGSNDAIDDEKNDVWASFVATKTHYILSLVGGADKVEVFSDSCTGSMKHELNIWGAEKREKWLSDLEVGKTYYLRFFNLKDTLKICLATPPDAPSNDLFKNAQTIIPSPTLSCATSTVGTVAWATPSTYNPSLYIGADEADVWYKFKATSTRHSINFSNYTTTENNSYPLFRVYSYQNNVLQVINYSDITNSNPKFYLNADSFYYIRVSVYPARLDVPHSFNLCIQTDPDYNFHPPSNDACENAILITPDDFTNCSKNTYQISEATPTLTSIQSGCYLAQNANDVWFKFVAEQTTHELVLKNHEKNGTLNFVLYEGTCTNLTLIQCGGNPFNGILKNLTIGKTYWIRAALLYQYSDFFDICLKNLPPPALNDKVCNAKNVSVNPTPTPTSFVEGYTIDATYSKTNENCTSFIDTTKARDVWYKFTATSTDTWMRVYNWEEIGGVELKLQLSVFKSTDCQEAMTEITCNESSSGLQLQLTDAVIGATYYVRVRSLENSINRFRFAAFSGATNYECAKATEIIVPALGESALQEGSTALPLTYQPNVNAFKTANSYFYFKASSSLMSIDFGGLYDWKDATSPNNYIYATLRKGRCTSNNPLLEYSVNQPSKLFLTNLEKDSIYTLFFYPSNGYYFDNFTFKLAAYMPKGNTCADAQMVPVNPSTELVATLADTLTVLYQGDISKHWYKFTATNDKHLIYLKRSKSLPFAQYSNQIRSTCNEIGDIRTDFINDTLLLGSNLTIGKTYFFSVIINDQHNNITIFPIEVGITTPEPSTQVNDRCNGAIPLTVGLDCNNPSYFHVKNASSDPRECYLNYTETVWHDFVATSSLVQIRVDSLNVVGNPIPYGFDVILLEGDDCDNLKNKDCLGVSIGYPNYFQHLTIGKHYYFQLLYPKYQAEYDYGICLSSPPIPANDSCSGATNIPVSLTTMPIEIISGSTKFSSTSFANNFAGSDIWYKFTALAPIHTLNVTAGGEYQNSVIYVFKGNSCTKLGESIYYHQFNYSYIGRTDLYDLNVGETYYILIADPNFPGRCTIQLDITTPAAAPINDLCADAISVPVNPTAICQQSINGTTKWARSNNINNGTQPCFGWGRNGDVWYKFIANNTIQKITIEYLDTAMSYHPGLYVTVYPADCDDIGNQQGQCLYQIDSSSVFASDLVVGQTYLLQLANVYQQLAQGENFNLCITSPTIAANLRCNQAQIVPVSDTSFCKNYYHQDLKNVPKIKHNLYVSWWGDNYQGRVVWYKFQATSTRHQLKIANIVKNPNNRASFVYAMYKECGGNLINTKPLFSNSPYNYPQDTIWTKLEIGKTYYIAINPVQFDLFNQESNDSLSFDVGISTWTRYAVNDEPTEAITVPVNNSYLCQTTTYGNTLTATQSPNIWKGCPGGDDDLWYKFTPTKPQYFITLKNIQPILGDVIDMNYDIYKAGDNGLFEVDNYIACQTAREYPLAPWGFEVGITYYIRVYTTYLNNYSRCSFELCIAAPIPQDEIKGAVTTTLFASNEEIGGCERVANATSVGATYSYKAGVPTNTCNQKTLPKDIWFQTIISSTKPNLTFKFNATPTEASAQVAAYRLKNNQLTFLPSDTCLLDTLKGMQQGDTILFRVWDALNTHFGNYQICINEIGKIISTTETSCVNCNTITIQPNPATDEITVKISTLGNKVFTTRIINVLGQEVHRQKFGLQEGQSSITLPIANLPQGNYQLLLSDGQRMYHKGFVKMN
jgi:hypothetical protein